MKRNLNSLNQPDKHNLLMGLLLLLLLLFMVLIVAVPKVHGI